MGCVAPQAEGGVQPDDAPLGAPTAAKSASPPAASRSGPAVAVPAGVDTIVKPENRVNDIWSVFAQMKLLGQGAFGEVWLAIDRATNQPFALKLLNRKDPTVLEMFVHEATMLKRLNHPHILAFHDAYCTPSHWAIATQYLKGGELFDRLADIQDYSEKAAAVRRCVVLRCGCVW